MKRRKIILMGGEDLFRHKTLNHLIYINGSRNILIKKEFNNLRDVSIYHYKTPHTLYYLWNLDNPHSPGLQYYGGTSSLISFGKITGNIHDYLSEVLTREIIDKNYIRAARDLAYLLDRKSVGG